MHYMQHKLFGLKRYLSFALGGGIVFITIILILAAFSGWLFDRFPQLLVAIKNVMAGISQKIDHSTAGGMAIKIFINNWRIAIAPLLIFSLQLLPLPIIKTLAVYLSLAVGLFIYATNAVALGLGFGMLAMQMQVSYIILFLISMVHGIFELFAISAGVLFPLYYLSTAASQSDSVTGSLAEAQQLIFKLLPIVTVALVVAALLEIYVTSPLAAKIILG